MGDATSYNVHTSAGGWMGDVNCGGTIRAVECDTALLQMKGGRAKRE